MSLLDGQASFTFIYKTNFKHLKINLLKTLLRSRESLKTFDWYCTYASVTPSNFVDSSCIYSIKTLISLDTLFAFLLLYKQKNDCAHFIMHSKMPLCYIMTLQFIYVCVCVFLLLKSEQAGVRPADLLTAGQSKVFRLCRNLQTSASTKRASRTFPHCLQYVNVCITACMK